MRDLTQNIQALTASGKSAYIITIEPRFNEYSRICFSTETLTFLMASASDGSFGTGSEGRLSQVLTSSIGFTGSEILRGDTINLANQTFTVESVIDNSHLKLDSTFTASSGIGFTASRVTDGNRIIKESLGIDEKSVNIEQGGAVGSVGSFRFSVANADNFINELLFTRLQNRRVDLRMIGVTGSQTTYNWFNEAMTVDKLILDDFSFTETELTLNFRDNSLIYHRPIPQNKILLTDFSFADPANLNRPISLIYGKYDDINTKFNIISGLGVHKSLNVDRLSRVYINSDHTSEDTGSIYFWDNRLKQYAPFFRETASDSHSGVTNKSFHQVQSNRYTRISRASDPLDEQIGVPVFLTESGDWGDFTNVFDLDVTTEGPELGDNITDTGSFAIGAKLQDVDIQSTASSRIFQHIDVDISASFTSVGLAYRLQSLKLKSQGSDGFTDGTVNFNSSESFFLTDRIEPDVDRIVIETPTGKISRNIIGTGSGGSGQSNITMSATVPTNTIQNFSIYKYQQARVLFVTQSVSGTAQFDGKQEVSRFVDIVEPSYWGGSQGGASREIDHSFLLLSTEYSNAIGQNRTVKIREMWLSYEDSIREFPEILYSSANGRPYDTWIDRNSLPSASGELIRNVASNIESLYRDVLGISNIHTASFDNVLTGSRANYLVDYEISDEKESLDIIDEICNQNMIIQFTDNNGLEKIVAIDSGSTSIKSFTNGDYVEESYKVEMSKIADLRNDFEFLYRFDPGSNDYLSREHASQTSGSIGSDYTTICSASVSDFGFEKKLTIKSDFVRDQASAQEMLRQIVEHRAKRKRIIKFELPLTGLSLELGDIISPNHTVWHPNGSTMITEIRHDLSNDRIFITCRDLLNPSDTVELGVAEGQNSIGGTAI